MPQTQAIRRAVGLILYVGDVAAEKTFRAEQENHNQNRKGDDASFHSEPLRDQSRRQRFQARRVNPPHIAPAMFPIPPSTAAVNAFSPGTKPMLYLIDP